MPINSNHDQAFLQKLTEITLANLTNNQFGVSELASEMGKSRSYIYLRLKRLTGEAVSQFIRRIRLEKGLELLRQDQLTVAEIAYDVGFGSPSYFIKCFHDHYGYPPGEVKNRVYEVSSSESILIHKKLRKAINYNLVETSSVVNNKRTFYIKIFLVALFIIALSIGVWYNYFYTDLSILVIPFENFSKEQKNEHFIDGLREDIINDLFNVTDLRVLSRTSAEKFRNSNLTIRQIARKMKVRYVLEGSVRFDGDKFRISAQLIYAYPFREKHIWSDSFDRYLDNFIGVQDEIALKVASKIKTSLSENEIEQIQKSSTQNSQAYEYYLHARALLHKANSDQRTGFNFSGVQNCLKYYEMAVAEDENFAEAYAGLANANFQLSSWKIIPSNKGFLRAKELSLKAIEIDPDCAEAHCILGGYYVWRERNFEAGKAEYDISIQLNQNFATSRQHYAHYRMITGPIEEARLHINRALELEPYFWLTHSLNSWIYYFEGKYQEALDACIISHEFNPRDMQTDWLFVLNYAKLGEGEKMMKQLQQIAKRYSKTDDYAEAIQEAFNNSGIEGLFYWLIDVNKNDPIRVIGMNGHPFFISWWNAILGNKEEAVYWLEKVLDESRKYYSYLNLIGTNPDFDCLHDNPRYLKVIDKIGLSPFYNQRPE